MRIWWECSFLFLDYLDFCKRSHPLHFYYSMPHIPSKYHFTPYFRHFAPFWLCLWWDAPILGRTSPDFVKTISVSLLCVRCRNWLKCVWRSYGNCVRGSLPWAVSVSFSVLSPPDWLKIKWSGRILLLHTFGKSLPQCCCSLFSVSSMPVRGLKWLKQITGDPSHKDPNDWTSYFPSVFSQFL